MGVYSNLAVRVSNVWREMPVKNRRAIRLALWFEQKRRLCGRFLGDGASRNVYELRLDPRFVVKEEQSAARHLRHNWDEWWFWDATWYLDKTPLVARPLAISPSGRFIIMEKAVDCSVLEDCTKKEIARAHRTVPVPYRDKHDGNVGRRWDGTVVLLDYGGITP